MLIASYFVGRNDSGEAICIVVKGVFLDGYVAKESDLEFKVGRTDLIQIFEQDGYSDGFILPDLPDDIVNLLDGGKSINIVDVEAGKHFSCVIGQSSKKQTISV